MGAGAGEGGIKKGGKREKKEEKNSRKSPRTRTVRRLPSPLLPLGSGLILTVLGPSTVWYGHSWARWLAYKLILPCVPMPIINTLPCTLFLWPFSINPGRTRHLQACPFVNKPMSVNHWVKNSPKTDRHGEEPQGG